MTTVPGGPEIDLRIRPARWDDARRLWEWANDPSVRANAFHSEPIPWESHLDWFRARYDSPGTRFWILEAGGEPVGQIRYDRDNAGRAAEISFSVVGGYRGKGYGSLLVRQTLERARVELDVEEVVAVVFEGNTASLRSFFHAGLVEQAPVTFHGRRCHRLTWRSDRATEEREAAN